MDTQTQFVTDMNAVMREKRGAEMLYRDGMARYSAALQREQELRAGEHGILSALAASGECDWQRAPMAKAISDRLAAQYGRTPRTFNGFFVGAGLQSRTLTASATTGSYDVETAHPLSIEAARGANSFLNLCTLARPGANGNVMMGKMSTAPTVTVMQTEAVTQAAAVVPTTTQSLLAPTGHTTYIEESRPFVLQTGGLGATAIESLILAALRTQVQVQILNGSGSNGQVLGLCNDATVATTNGGTLTWAMVAGAMETVEAGAGDAELAWVVTAGAATIMRQRAQISGGDAILKDGRIGGYRCIVVGGTTAKVAVFGRWVDLMLYEWAPIELAVHPFANFQAGIIGVRGWATFNAAPKVAGSFATITGIT